MKPPIYTGLPGDAALDRLAGHLSPGSAVTPQAAANSLIARNAQAGSAGIGPEALAGLDGLGVKLGLVNPAAEGGGFNLDGLSTLSQGLASLGQLYTAFRANKLAKEQFAFSKAAYEKNLANQTRSYNTDLAGRARAQFTAENRLDELDGYLAKHRL